MLKLVIKFSQRTVFLYDLVVVSIDKKKGRKVVLEKLGHIDLSPTSGKGSAINFARYGYWLNRGAILRKSKFFSSEFLKPWD